jgi:hypothetical protein
VPFAYLEIAVCSDLVDFLVGSIVLLMAPFCSIGMLVCRWETDLR